MDHGQIIDDYHGWLYQVAMDMLPVGSPQIDDLVQEGRIAMWRALDTYDSSKGSLPSWLTGAARLRMRDLAWGSGRPTGHISQRGSREVDLGPSLDASDDPDALCGFVEEAYADGDILRALEVLSPSQREYVYLRFWGGLEPSSKVPEMKMLVDEFPVLRKRFLWTGSSKQVGALARLRERLADHAA